ncbi:GD25565 [Drosophila simulans]|uniref:GD25565 n=1 Tax=Drosophila simulans TaxID=7240 RepID=B4QHG2_DROSI|nr:GD25565 [Drosophila simulans]
MNLRKYNYLNTIYNKCRTLNCDKLRPENKYLNCVNVSGKLYSLYNLCEDIEAGNSLKKNQSKRNKRFRIKPLRSKKDTKISNLINPNIIERKSRRQSAKNTSDKGLMSSDVDMEPPPSVDPMERISEVEPSLETEKPRRPRGRPKKVVISSSPIVLDQGKENSMEIDDEQVALARILKTVKHKVSKYFEDMEMAACLPKQKKKSQQHGYRRKLGLAKLRQPGRIKKDSSKSSTDCSTTLVLRRSAGMSAAKLKKEQQLLQKDKKKQNSRMAVDWKQLDRPEKVKGPPVVLRRSARIQAAKLKKEALEAAKLRESKLEKPSTRKVSSKPRINQLVVCRSCSNYNSITYPMPQYLNTIFECADINGRLYKLN